MAIQNETKKVILSQVKEDLLSGLTRWKKDDIGFGSLEKKYNLSLKESIDLFAHPKIKDIETKLPTFVIIDDIEDEITEPLIESKIEVVKPVITDSITVSKPQQTKIIKQEKIEAFI